MVVFVVQAHDLLCVDRVELDRVVMDVAKELTIGADDVLADAAGVCGLVRAAQQAAVISATLRLLISRAQFALVETPGPASARDHDVPAFSVLWMARRTDNALFIITSPETTVAGYIHLVAGLVPDQAARDGGDLGLVGHR